jgi:uncharacterized protein (TIGR02001 family)
VELKTTQKMVLAAMALSGAAFAQTPAPKAPEPDYTFAFNVGAVTEYRYRGLSQSGMKPALQGGIMLIASVVILVNLIIDLLYGLINPRIRHGH